MKFFVTIFLLIPSFSFNVNAQSIIESIYYHKLKLNNYNRNYSLKYNGTLKPSFNKFPKILYKKTDASFIEVSPEHYRNSIKYNLDSGKWNQRNDTIFFNYFPKQQVQIKSKNTNDRLLIVLFNTNGDSQLTNYSIDIYYKNKLYKSTTNNIGEINLNINSFDSIYVNDDQFTTYPLKIYNFDALANYFEIYIYKKGDCYLSENKFLHKISASGYEKYFKRKRILNKYLSLYNQLINEQNKNKN